MKRCNLFTVLLAATLVTASAEPTSAQHVEHEFDHEFTEEELFQVYRRVLPESEARFLARSSLPSGRLGERQPGVPGLELQAVEHTDLSFDTLVMLSLLSDVAKAKAERYLASMYNGHVPPAEQARWEQRRAEMRQWAEAGYPME